MTLRATQAGTLCSCKGLTSLTGHKSVARLRDKLVLQEWGFCGWVGNPPRENKVLISKDANPCITSSQLQTSRKKRSWTPQETMAMRRCRNRSNDLIHEGRWWWWWWWWILGKNLGLLPERMYHVKSDSSKCRYTNTLPPCLITATIGQVEYFHEKRQAGNLEGGSHWQETECLYETHSSRTSVEEGTFLGFLSCRSFFNRYHRVHVNRYSYTHTHTHTHTHTQVRDGDPDFRQFYGLNQNIYRNERAPNICVTWQNLRTNIWLENQVLATYVFCFVYLTLLYNPKTV